MLPQRLENIFLFLLNKTLLKILMVDLKFHVGYSFHLYSSDRSGLTYANEVNKCVVFILDGMPFLLPMMIR